MADEQTAVLDPNVSAQTQQTQQTNGQQPTESWSKEWLKPDGSLDHTAFDKAPDELKSFRKDVERYKTVDEYLKGQRERDSLLGKKGLVEPLSDKATEQEKSERSALLRKVNGAPEKPDGYGLVRPQDVPEGQWDQKYADTVAAIAHKHGLPPAALKELAATEMAREKAGEEAVKAQEKAWFEGQDKMIRGELEKQGMDFAKGKDLAERAGRKWGIDPANPLMKNASVFMLLTRLGKAGAEDTLIKGDTDEFGINNGLSAEAANKAADDIMQNKDNPDYKAWHEQGHPDHAKAVAKWQRLVGIVAKSKPARSLR